MTDREKWIIGLALVGAVYCAAIAAWSFSQELHPLPSWLSVAGPVGVVPTFVVAILIRRRRTAFSGSAKFTADTRRRIAASIAVSMIILGLVSLLIVVGVVPDHNIPLGQPEVVDGDYFVNFHGALTPVTKADYLRAVSAQHRTYSVIAYFLYCVAILIVAVSFENKSRLTNRGNSVRP